MGPLIQFFNLFCHIVYVLKQLNLSVKQKLPNFGPPTLSCKHTNIMQYYELKFLLCIGYDMNIVHVENGDSGNCLYYIMLPNLNGDIFIETPCTC